MVGPSLTFLELRCYQALHSSSVRGLPKRESYVRLHSLVHVPLETWTTSAMFCQRSVQEGVL